MRRPLVSLLVVSSLVLVVVACKATDPPPVCTGSGSTAHRDIRYSQTAGTIANLQSLDLYLPVRPAGCGPAPLVVYVHGGGFVNGDKANQIANKVTLFTKQGWAFASVNYRLVGSPGVGPGNGMYPEAEQDVAAAISYLEQHASENGIDASRVMTLGHSSGAFLVALDATDSSFLVNAGRRPESVVCAAPLDTTYDITAQITSHSSEEAMYRNAFGNDPAVWDRGSPAHNVAAGKWIPAFHIVTRGTSARVAQAQAFATKLRNAGGTAGVQVVAGLSHEAVNAAVGAPGETTVTGPLMSFFQGCANKAPLPQ